MKIGYFSSKFPYITIQQNSPNNYKYTYGGSVLATYYLALEMSRKGKDIMVFTTSYNSKDSIEEYNNLKIYRYGTNFRFLTSNISLGYFYKPLTYNADIVHVSFDIPPSPFAGLIYTRKKNLPLVITYHGDWEDSYGNILRRLGVGFHNRLLVDKLLSAAKVIISPSSIYINSSKFLKKYEDKIIVIPNGINLEEFKIPYSKKECREKLGLPTHKNIILFFGYLVPYKSPDILLKTFPKILKKVPDTLLVFAGNGVMEEELKRLSIELKVEKCVIFAGYVGKEHRPLYYKAADIFCLPSTMRTECHPIAILEAMACGIPIVASKIGGIPDIVKDGENGLLVPPKDENALADAIIYLLENKDIRERMGRNGRDKVERYSWEKIAEETEKIYEELI